MSLRCWLCGICVGAWVTVAPAAAPARTDATAAELPGFAVLVLQPVGDKRVRPVTGVVVGAEGTVVVPADFAAPGDVLIVLDGGSDILEHGRPALVRAHDPAAGITLLEVRGLQRTPARLTAGPLTAGTELHLAAFPPAEQIAAGARPLWLPARYGALAASGVDAAGAAGSGAAAAALPNVSGPLLDACGYLAGYSVAAGLPGMDASPETGYLWADALQQALHAAGVAPTVAACAAGADSADEAAAGPATAAPVAPPMPDAVVTVGLPAGSASSPPPAGVPALGWAAAALGVLAAALAAWRLRCGRRRRPPALLQDAIVARGAGAAPGAVGGAVAAATGDWSLEIRGQLPGGVEFARRCPVNPAAVDVLIGSGAGDIRIEARGIGHEHARLGGSRSALTITDLGSSGGTWVGRVPCTRGEVLFIGADDTVVLGETGFRIRLLPPAAEPHGGAAEA